MTAADRNKTRLKKSGALPPSPERVLRTSVNWFGTGLPRSKDAEYGSRTLPVKLLSDKDHAHKEHRAGLPMMIYFAAEGDDEEAFIELETKLWRDEHIGLASSVFNCYRISLDDIESEHDRNLYGDEPQVVFISPSGRTVGKLSGWKISNKKLFKTMRSVARKQWKKDLKKILPKQAAILKTYDEVFDEIERERRALAKDEDHIKVHNCAPARKRIKKRKKAIADAEKRRVDAEKAEAKLFAFLQPKKDKKSGGAKVKSNTE